MAMSDDVKAAVAGLIVSDGQGHYFAIAWPDLQRHRVPAGWEAALAVAVSGAEPVTPVLELHGYDTVTSPSPSPVPMPTPVPDEQALLLEATTPGRFRLASRRLEAWLLIR